MKSLAALCCLLILFSPLQAGAGTALWGRVVEVVDGDTVTVETSDGKVEQVRYIGIDCPETSHPRRRVEELGREASRFNRSLVLGRRVLLELDLQKKDRYGRTLAYVWVESDEGSFMANELLVSSGLAVPYAIPQICATQTFSGRPSPVPGPPGEASGKRLVEGCSLQPRYGRNYPRWRGVLSTYGSRWIAFPLPGPATRYVLIKAIPL